MAVIDVTKENFESEILLSKTPVLVDFYADWCGPCKMVAPVISQIAEERSDIKVCRINVDTEPEIAADYAVSSIPALFVFKNGEVFSQTVGAHPKAAILRLLGD